MTDRRDSMGVGIPRSELWHRANTGRKRDMLTKILLTGNPENRRSLQVKLAACFPYSATLDNARVVGRCLNFLLVFGVLERVGRDQVRVRPCLLEMLREVQEV
jgi:hypothetical protein